MGFTLVAAAQDHSHHLPRNMDSHMSLVAQDFPQANGEAERAVATVKNLLKKSVDPYLALLVYRKSL